MFGSFKRFIQAWALVWAWQWPRAHQRDLTTQVSITREWQSRREKRKIRLRQQIVFRHPPRRLVIKGGYRGTQARDARFSNQRALRRMYRNV